MHICRLRGVTQLQCWIAIVLESFEKHLFPTTSLLACHSLQLLHLGWSYRVNMTYWRFWVLQIPNGIARWHCSSLIGSLLWQRRHQALIISAIIAEGIKKCMPLMNKLHLSWRQACFCPVVHLSWVNAGLQGEKQVCYLCAMLPPHRANFDLHFPDPRLRVRQANDRLRPRCEEHREDQLEGG